MKFCRIKTDDLKYEIFHFVSKFNDRLKHLAIHVMEKR